MTEFGTSNAGRTYNGNGSVIKSVDFRRDLRVQVHSSLKIDTQMVRLVNMAFCMPSFTGEGIEYELAHNVAAIQNIGKGTLGV